MTPSRTTTAGKRALVDLSRDRTFAERANRARPRLRRRRRAASGSSRRATRSRPASISSSMDADADLAALAAAGAARRHRALRGAEGASGRARLPRSAARARDLVRDNARCGAGSSALQAHLRRRVPGHRSAAGGDPAAARGRRRRARPTGGGVPAPGHAVPRRRSRSSRSTGSGAPTSASTARSASGCEAQGATAAAPEHELPQRAGDPGVRERAFAPVMTGDPVTLQAPLRAARPSPRQHWRASRPSSRCRSRSRTSGAT